MRRLFQSRSGEGERERSRPPRGGGPGRLRSAPQSRSGEGEREEPRKPPPRRSRSSRGGGAGAVAKRAPIALGGGGARTAVVETIAAATVVVAVVAAVVAAATVVVAVAAAGRRVALGTTPVVVGVCAGGTLGLAILAVARVAVVVAITAEAAAAIVAIEAAAAVVAIEAAAAVVAIVPAAISSVILKRAAELAGRATLVLLVGVAHGRTGGELEVDVVHGAAAEAAAAGGTVGAAAAGDGVEIGEGHLLALLGLLARRLRGGAEVGEVIVGLLLQGLAEAGKGALGGEGRLGVVSVFFGLATRDERGVRRGGKGSRSVAAPGGGVRARAVRRRGGGGATSRRADVARRLERASVRNARRRGAAARWASLGTTARVRRNHDARRRVDGAPERRALRATAPACPARDANDASRRSLSRNPRDASRELASAFGRDVAAISPAGDAREGAAAGQDAERLVLIFWRRRGGEEGTGEARTWLAQAPEAPHADMLELA